MEEFFASGRAVDLVLAVMAAEFAVLSARAGSPLRAAAMTNAAFALLPGACLLLALRASLTGASWPWIAFWLAASFPFHLMDLRRRASSE